MSYTNKAQLKEINGHYYLLFKNGRIDRLPVDKTPNGLSFEQIKAAIEHFSFGKANIEVVN